MTAIVAVVQNGRAYIGADSVGSDGHRLQCRKDPKVFRCGDCLIGFTSSFRMGQIIRYHFSPPRPTDGEDGMSYMVRQFIPAIRDVLRSHGYMKTSDGVETGGTFIVIRKGEIFMVDSDFQVGQVHESYAACGSGVDVTRGSLHTTDGMNIAPSRRIKLALSAAEWFLNSVRGPFVTLSQKCGN